MFYIIHASQKYYFLKIIAAKAVLHKHYVVFGIFPCAFWSILLPLREQFVCFVYYRQPCNTQGYFSSSRKMSSKENIHKRVFITLASKKKSWVCYCSLRVVAGREKTKPSKWENVLDGEAVVIRTKQPMFSAPAPIPRTVYFMDLLSLIKEVHSLWCCSKVMWKLSICSINLAQLEVISSYNGGMDRTQDTSISLMYRGPCMRLAHGLFCWKWNLSFFASPPCEEGKTEREDERRSIHSSHSNLKQYWHREFGEIA